MNEKDTLKRVLFFMLID